MRIVLGNEGSGSRRIKSILNEYGYIFVKYRINGRRINNLRTEVAQFHRFDKRQPLDDISRIDSPGVGCHEAIDIGPDFELRGIESGSQDSCRIIRSPTPQIGDIAIAFVGGDESRNDGYTRQWIKTGFHQPVGLLEIDNVFTTLHLCLDEPTGIVMLGPVDNPADNQRGETLAVADNRVEGLYRQVFNERHAFENISQLIEQRLYERQKFVSLMRIDSAMYHGNVPIYDFTKTVFISITAFHCDFGRANEFIGYSPQRRNHYNNRLPTTLDYMFDTRHALYRADRRASEFQYFHI